MIQKCWKTIGSMFVAMVLSASGFAGQADAQVGSMMDAVKDSATKTVADQMTESATKAVADALQSAAVGGLAVRKFTVVNVLYEGSKMFVPSMLIVEKGEKVQIKIINKIPGDPPNHGFSIPAFGVEEVVNSGESKTVEFTADKAGLFEVKCQLHPAHVHAQLLVRGGGKNK